MALGAPPDPSYKSSRGSAPEEVVQKPPQDSVWRGVRIPAWEELDDGDVEWLGRHGINCIRLPLDPLRFTEGEKRDQAMDAVVRWCEHRDMTVVLEASTTPPLFRSSQEAEEWACDCRTATKKSVAYWASHWGRRKGLGGIACGRVPGTPEELAALYEDIATQCLPSLRSGVPLILDTTRDPRAWNGRLGAFDSIAHPVIFDILEPLHMAHNEVQREEQARVAREVWDLIRVAQSDFEDGALAAAVMAAAGLWEPLLALGRVGDAAALTVADPVLRLSLATLVREREGCEGIMPIPNTDAECTSEWLRLDVDAKCVAEGTVGGVWEELDAKCRLRFGRAAVGIREHRAEVARRAASRSDLGGDGMVTPEALCSAQCHGSAASASAGACWERPSVVTVSDFSAGRGAMCLRIVGLEEAAVATPTWGSTLDDSEWSVALDETEHKLARHPRVPGCWWVTFTPSGDSLRLLRHSLTPGGHLLRPPPQSYDAIDGPLNFEAPAKLKAQEGCVLLAGAVSGLVTLYVTAGATPDFVA
eukprot:Hpha_TRINITY_DN31443_c0_g1::TRINITY_DN31443_c0_g1_i1::g.145369::m.145369